MENNCLLSATKRLRVAGTGPSRKLLKPFYKIATLPNTVVSALLSYASTHPENDLGTDEYAISRHCQIDTVFNAKQNYRQILLQTKNNNTNGSDVDEFQYTCWKDNTICTNLECLSEYISNIYRFRISIMGSNHSLNWHIDTDPSVICRAQICLQNTDSVFEFKTKTGYESFTMNPGDLYFVNTGWQHRVVNNSNSDRIVGIFGFKFSDLSLNVSSNLYIT